MYILYVDHKYQFFWNIVKEFSFSIFFWHFKYLTISFTLDDRTGARRSRSPLLCSISRKYLPSLSTRLWIFNAFKSPSRQPVVLAITSVSAYLPILLIFLLLKVYSLLCFTSLLWRIVKDTLILWTYTIPSTKRSILSLYTDFPSFPRVNTII